MYIYLKQPITRKQLADCLSVSTKTLHRWMQQIPHFERKGGKAMLDTEDVNAFFSHYRYHPTVLGDRAVLEPGRIYEAC